MALISLLPQSFALQKDAPEEPLMRKHTCHVLIFRNASVYRAKYTELQQAGGRTRWILDSRCTLARLPLARRLTYEMPRETSPE